MKRWNGRWVEWAAVLGCVGFGLAILFPAAGLARGLGKAEVCMANLHLLMRSWLAYAEDNDSKIVGSSTYEADGWQRRGYPAWSPSSTIRVKNFVANPQDQNGIYRNQEVQDEVRGLRRGGLWPYLEAEQPYHCPSDMRHLKPPTGIYAPNEKGGYRSYSIGSVYNGYGIGDGWATGEYYATVYRTTEIVNPEDKIVFLEEQDPQGWNINTWDIFLTGATFPNFWPGDPLACIHNQRTNFGFADGHTEQHPWKDKAVIKTFVDQIKNGSTPPTNPDYRFGPDEGGDLGWFVRHYVPRTPQTGSNFYPLPK